MFADLIMKTDWSDKSQRYFVSREQEYVNCLKAAFGMYDLLKNNRMTLEDGYLIRQLVASPGGLELHVGMFIPALFSQAFPEQRNKWLPLPKTTRLYGLTLRPSLAMDLLSEASKPRPLTTRHPSSSSSIPPPRQPPIGGQVVSAIRHSRRPHGQTLHRRHQLRTPRLHLPSAVAGRPLRSA